MPLPFYRVMCGTCDCVISDGWPGHPDVDPDVPRVISRHLCRGCEEEAALQAAEDQRRGLVTT